MPTTRTVVSIMCLETAPILEARSAGEGTINGESLIYKRTEVAWNGGMQQNSESEDSRDVETENLGL